MPTIIVSDPSGLALLQSAASTILYNFDWTAFLAQTSTSIVSSSFTVAASGVVINNGTVANVTSVLLSGAQDQTTVILTNTITTANGQTESLQIFVRIQSISLVVEDGTGLLNAESYCDVPTADFYHFNRNNTVWSSLDNATKEACLRKASTYMVSAYRSRWKGRRVKFHQTLDWPRVGVYLDDFAGSYGRNGFGSYGYFQVDYKIVPAEIINACAEYALRASIAPLSPDLTQNVLQKTVGPITVKYDSNSPQQKRYLEIDRMVSIYFESSNLMHKLVRA